MPGLHRATPNEGCPGHLPVQLFYLWPCTSSADTVSCGASHKENVTRPATLQAGVSQRAGPMAGLLAETIDHGLASIMLVLILLFTLVWEDLTDRLEEHVEDNEHYYAMVTKVYRELMILGFISFSVVLSNEFDFWEYHSDLIAFEFAHLLVFGVSLFFVVTTIVASERLEVTNRLYTRIGNLNANVLADNLDRELKTMLEGANKAKPHSHWSPLWMSLKPGASIWEDAEWKVMRLLFLKEFKIGAEFDYGDYVKRKLSSKLSHSLHVHPTTWGLVMVCSLVFYGIRYWVKGDECDCSGDGNRRLMETQMAWRQLGAGASGGGCDCSEQEAAVTVASRRQLGAAAPAPPQCTPTSEGALFDGEWYCSPNVSGVVNITVGNITEMVCILDHYTAPNATVEEPYVNKDALVTLLAPGLVSFMLFFLQAYVLFAIKRALHSVLQTKGCKDFRQLPSFLREMDAWVTMKNMLPSLAMFEGCGDGFVSAAIDKMVLNFYKHGDSIVTEGEMGSSMYFICTGSVDVSSQTGKVLGSLVSGDYFGESSVVLLDQPRSTNIVARTPCSCFELHRASLDQLQLEFPYAVKQMEEIVQAQHAAALQGKWSPEQMSAKSTARHKQNEQKIAEHSVRLKKEQADAQAQAEKESKTLKLPKMNLNRMMSNDVGGMAKGAGHAAKTVGKKVAATATNPTKLAIGLAKIAGLPGTGLLVKDDGHGHGHGHGHGQLDKMEDADHIMTQAKKHFLEEITEITMLFNCFTLGYYCLHCGKFLYYRKGPTVETAVLVGYVFQLCIVCRIT